MRLLYNKGDRPAQNDIEEGDDVYNLPDSKRYTKTHSGDIVQIDSSPLTGYKNLLINGGFDVWQRGDTVSGINKYLGPDRFLFSYNTNPIDVYTVKEDLNTPKIGSAYTLRVHSNNVATNPNSNINMSHFIEGGIGAMSDGTTPRTWTLSFWAKSNNGDTTLTLRDNISLTITDVWTKFTHTHTDEITDYVAFVFENERVLDMNFAEIQAEYNDTATNFEQRSTALEESLCHRYYQQTVDHTNYVKNISVSEVLAGWTLAAYPGIIFPIQMRVTPTMTIYSSDGTSGTMGLNSGINHDLTVEGMDVSPIGIGYITFSPAANVGDNAIFTYIADAEIY